MHISEGPSSVCQPVCECLALKRRKPLYTLVRGAWQEMRVEGGKRSGREGK